MSEFDVEAFVAKLDRLGIRLTAFRLADGTLKIYRWRMRGARESAQQIDDLWSSTIGEDRARNDRLAEHLLAIAANQDKGTGAHFANKPPDDAA